MKTTAKGNVIAASAIYLGLILVCVYAVQWRGLKTIAMIDLISVSFDCFGMLIGFVLCICCLLDVQKTGTDLRYFRYLLNVTYLGMFTDAISSIIEGVPNLSTAILVNSSLYFMYMPLMIYFFWRYISTFMNFEGRFEHVVGQFLKYGLILMAAAAIANLFAGFFFTIGADGEYTRGPVFPLATLYGFAGTVLLIIVILRKRSQLKRFQVIALLIYVIAALIGAALSVTFKGFNVGSCEAVLIMLLMYCVLNIEQGRDKAAVDAELSMAAQIQEHILPQEFPYMPDRREFDLHASMTPAKDVGGDFYDFFMIDDDHLAAVVGDVSGKGVPASLFMMVSKR